MAKAGSSSEKIQPSSGNVVADLGLPNAEELDTKVRLAVAINRELDARKRTQATAAATLAISQPKGLLLRHYKLKGFSVERLMLLLTALGSDIEMRIRSPVAARRAGRILVQAASVPSVPAGRISPRRSFFLQRPYSYRRARMRCAVMTPALKLPAKPSHGAACWPSAFAYKRPPPRGA